MPGLPLSVLKLFGGQQVSRKPFTPVQPRGVVECGFTSLGLEADVVFQTWLRQQHYCSSTMLMRSKKNRAYWGFNGHGRAGRAASYGLGTNIHYVTVI